MMDRIVSASLTRMLEDAPALISEGCANIVSVAAIRDCSGERWPRKQPQVATYLTRAFERSRSPADAIRPLNDTEFITIQPYATRTAALAHSRNLLRDTLEHFLGEAKAEDIRVFRVTGLENGMLKVAPAPQGFCEPPQGASPATPAGDGWAPQQGDSPRRAPRLDSQPDLSLNVDLEPVWSPRAGAFAFVALRPRLEGASPSGTAQTGGFLCARELGEIAVSVLTTAADLLAQAETTAVIVPIPAGCLASATTRQQLAHVFSGVEPAKRRRLVVELVEIAEGLPPGRLTELVSLLRPWCRAVIARAASESTDLRRWAGCGLGGVSLDASGLSPHERASVERLRTFADGALSAAPSCMGYNLSSRALLLAAWAAGFTHLAGADVTRMLSGRRSGVKLNPAALYAEAAHR